MGFPSIEERLERLEKQNRWLRMLVLALIFLAGGGVMLSVVSGVRAQAPAWKRTVEAGKFVLRDSSGKTRAMLGMIPTGPVLRMYDTSGTPRAALSVSEVGAGLGLYDTSGQMRAVLDMFAGNQNLTLLDASGAQLARLDGSADGPSLTLQDSGGFKSVVGHVALQTPATGEQSQSSAASIHLFNKAGKVIWAAP
jgi:hypothetical protein